MGERLPPPQVWADAIWPGAWNYRDPEGPGRRVKEHVVLALDQFEGLIDEQPAATGSFQRALTVPRDWYRWPASTTAEAVVDARSIA